MVLVSPSLSDYESLLHVLLSEHVPAQRRPEAAQGTPEAAIRAASHAKHVAHQASAGRGSEFQPGPS
jgi:hypothetical protein